MRCWEKVRVARPPKETGVVKASGAKEDVAGAPPSAGTALLNKGDARMGAS